MNEIVVKSPSYNMTIQNSFGEVAQCLTAQGNGSGYPGTQLSQTDTLFINNRWYLISNFQQLLSQIYVEHGIVQTLIDQPVDDAFRAGIDIKTSQLDSNEIEQLQIFCEELQLIDEIKQAAKWARLFGGAAILTITNQDPSTPLTIEALKENSPIEFRAVDMWELYYDAATLAGTMSTPAFLAPEPQFYNYYGVRIHPSRVKIIKGKKPPSFIRPRLRGWGMSEVERLVRSLNQYLKNQDVIFELLDEAKIDVYKIAGMNQALLTSEGTQSITKRIGYGNMVKNFNNAIVMDKNDDYEQKQMNFTGLDAMLTQIRQGLAADVKMPITKLFGVSSSGFNSGEDDIENYNSMVESEVRSKVKFIVVHMLKIACQKLFGFIPDDLMISFPSLRIMSSEDEEKVKDSQFTRTLSAYQAGLTSDLETKQALNKDSLLPVEIDENVAAFEALGGDSQTIEEKKNAIKIVSNRFSFKHLISRKKVSGR